MIPALRQRYNAAFTDTRYAAFTRELNRSMYWPVDFRVAESPLFLDEPTTRALVDAATDITRQLATPEFRQHAANAVPANLSVPHETEFPHFLCIDFALCHDTDGRVLPQLIELQGFPTVACWQVLLTNTYRAHFPEIPPEFTPYFADVAQASRLPSGSSPPTPAEQDDHYLDELRSAILGDCLPENVVLLEIEPEKQKTRIDFACTHSLLNVRPMCLSKIRQRGRQLVYFSGGREVPIHRLYNRVIFDELLRKPDFKPGFNLRDDRLDVQWVSHPNWYFRISKHTLPFLKSRYVPDCRFVSELAGNIPADLENYVLKPLYSFAGLGVDIAPTREKIAALSNPAEWLLQRKVAYAPILATPDGPAKAEVRLILVGDGTEMPRLVNQLVRLTKGAMHGVDFNKGKTWVGASAGFHPPP
ncbi:MAG: hypothetical protein HYV96_07435 [Opitutae bacterium]|nr:hypothetical protein [Opitutae bacterium]